MKPTLVADEMFPEGAGPYMDLEEVLLNKLDDVSWDKLNGMCTCLLETVRRLHIPFLDTVKAGGSSGLLMDLAANEKAVHADFFNDFDELFDDDDLQ